MSKENIEKLQLLQSKLSEWTKAIKIARNNDEELSETIETFDKEIRDMQANTAKALGKLGGGKKLSTEDRKKMTDNLATIKAKIEKGAEWLNEQVKNVDLYLKNAETDEHIEN